MVFILYKLYILSPYTNSTPKPTHQTKLSAFAVDGDLWDAHLGHEAPVPAHPKDALLG